jgi:hypothetical protein
MSTYCCRRLLQLAQLYDVHIKANCEVHESASMLVSTNPNLNRSRVAEWVRQLEACNKGRPAEEDRSDGGAEVEKKGGGRRGSGGLRDGGLGLAPVRGGGNSAALADDSRTHHPAPGAGNKPGLGAAAMGEAAESQVSGSEPGDGESVAAGDHHADEDLASDFR